MNALTTNHTYFWREYEQFLYLKQTVFPELKMRTENTKDWHIWCAASSTGEEPYTLAMLCKDFLGLEQAAWDTKVLATDIDTKVLEKAVKGVYSKGIHQVFCFWPCWKPLHTIHKRIVGIVSFSLHITIKSSLNQNFLFV